jgi:cytoplasmic iron level regulating protein YaaA (DUF328/UPF0246 family)
MRKALEAIADDLASVRTEQLERVKALRRDLLIAEAQLHATEEKQRALVLAIRAYDGVYQFRMVNNNDIDPKND